MGTPGQQPESNGFASIRLSFEDYRDRFQNPKGRALESFLLDKNSVNDLLDDVQNSLDILREYLNNSSGALSRDQSRQRQEMINVINETSNCCIAIAVHFDRSQFQQAAGQLRNLPGHLNQILSYMSSLQIK
jgi:hypothetical protein